MPPARKPGQPKKRKSLPQYSIPATYRAPGVEKLAQEETARMNDYLKKVKQSNRKSELRKLWSQPWFHQLPVTHERRDFWAKEVSAGRAKVVKRSDGHFTIVRTATAGKELHKSPESGSTKKKTSAKKTTKKSSSSTSKNTNSRTSPASRSSTKNSVAEPVSPSSAVVDMSGARIGSATSTGVNVDQGHIGTGNISNRAEGGVGGTANVYMSDRAFEQRREEQARDARAREEPEERDWEEEPEVQEQPEQRRDTGRRWYNPLTWFRRRR